MEPSGRNPWQPVANASGAKTAQIRETVAVGCDRLPRKCHGKEGVFGSSPEEGLKLLQIGHFCKGTGFAAASRLPALVHTHV